MLNLPLRWARYELVLRAEEPVRLPEYPGSVLRGAFGHELRRLTCLHPAADCATCERPGACAFGAIFAPKAHAPLHGVPPDAEAARPFVFEPPRGGDLRPGETFRFALLLFGRARAYLPYFLLAFRGLADQGLGRGRGRVTLEEVWAVDDLHGRQERIYTARDDLVRAVDLSLSAADLLSAIRHPPPPLVTLHFETNLRLIYRSQLLHEPLFPALFSRLLDRIDALCHLYGDGPPDHDPRALKLAAREVELVENHTRWKDWKRYSQRQEREFPLGGLVGSATYRGDLAPFLPYLRLGEYVHVGKGCVYGLGKIRVELER